METTETCGLVDISSVVCVVLNRPKQVSKLWNDKKNPRETDVQEQEEGGTTTLSLSLSLSRRASTSSSSTEGGEKTFQRKKIVKFHSPLFFLRRLFQAG